MYQRSRWARWYTVSLAGRRSVGPQVIGPGQVARVVLAAVYKFVDVDGARGFQRDVIEFILCHLNEGVGIELVAPHNVFVGHFLAGVGVHFDILDAVASLSVELVEGDLVRA